MNAKLNGWLIKAVIGLVSFGFGAGAALGAMNFRVNDVCKKMDDHEARIRTIERAVTETNGSLKNIDDSQKDTDDRLKTMNLDIIAIKLDLIEIKNAVK